MTNQFSKRIESIDLLRGLVMLLMLLDHTRSNFMSHLSLGGDPIDLSVASDELFWVRWITHFCAPVFVFLCGISAFLYEESRNNTGTQSHSVYLIKRGLLLALLEITLVNFSWEFIYPDAKIYLGVLWAIGWSMVILGLLIHLPTKFICILSVAVLIGQHLIPDLYFENQHSVTNWIWALFVERQVIPVTESVSVRTSYPILVWAALMAFGYVVGRIYVWPKEKRKKTLLQASIISIFAFLFLRITGLYGEDSAYDGTIQSLFNNTKYPPSVIFLLMTLGPSCLLLAFTETLKTRISKAIAIIGKEPLFFYILHLYAIQVQYEALKIWSGVPEPDKYTFSSMWYVYLSVIFWSYVMYRMTRYYRYFLSKK